MIVLDIEKLLDEQSNEYKTSADELLGDDDDAFFRKKVTLDNKQLLLFGSVHTNEPSHPQYDILPDLFGQFLKETEGSKQIVLIEGGDRGIENMSLEEALQTGSESGYMSKLAQIKNITYTSPEPPANEEVHYFRTKYSDEEIFYFYCMRQYRQRYRTYSHEENTHSFERYLNNWLQGDLEQEIIKSFGWNLEQGTYEYFLLVHRNITGKEREETDREEKFEAADPLHDFIITNKIAREDFRDRYILKQIETYLHNEYNIFLVYGSGHLVARRNIFGY